MWDRRYSILENYNLKSSQILHLQLEIFFFSKVSQCYIFKLVLTNFYLICSYYGHISPLPLCCELLEFSFCFLCLPQYLTELLALNKHTIKFIEEMWTVLDQFQVQLLYN